MWTPPKNPDPSAILYEAVEDGRNGREEIALEKFLWYHKKATEYQESLSAVRHSFALGYWMDLASHYPPAMEAFARTRDETEAAFLLDQSNFDLFHDMVSLNRELKTTERTASIFAKVAASDHEAAKGLYHVAEQYLIASGEFAACNLFLDPENRLEFAARCYRMTRRHEESRLAGPIPVPRTAEKHYVKEVSTLAALLVLNDRQVEAQRVYSESLKVIDNPDFRTTLDAAMTGHLPEG